MAANQGVTSSRASLLIPSHMEPNRHPEPRPLPVTSAIINLRRGGSTQTQAPRPPAPCGPQGPFRPCWNLDLRVAMLLVTVFGGLVLLLLFRLLQLRRRLQTARSRPALKYYRFYRAATYTLSPPEPHPAPPEKNGTTLEGAELFQTGAAPTETGFTVLPPAPPPPPLLPLPPPPVLLRTPPTPPPPILLRHSAPASPPHPAMPPFLTPPLGRATPPSPHLSWGAASDVVEVYSRIGAFRPARLSSLSSQTQVVLFEHSSL